MTANQARIILWTVPRSRSTAFTRAMLNKPRTKILLEPYLDAYYRGSERVSSRYDGVEPIKENCTFLDIKSLYEEPCPEYDMVFAKDFAHHLQGRINLTYLPAGYKHTFLIRDPLETVASRFRLITNKAVKGFDDLAMTSAWYKELYEMFVLVTEQLGQDAVVVDATDLLTDPEQIIQAYCGRVGIEFESRMLNWSDSAADLQMLTENEKMLPFFSDVLNTTTFQPYTTKPTPDMPGVCLAAIAEAQPYYDKLYQYRIKLNK